MNQLIHDFRAAWRSLLVHPGSTLFAIASLTLATVAVSAIVALGDRALVRTLPTSNPHELVIPQWHAGTEFPADSGSGRVAFDDAGRSTSTSFPPSAFRKFGAEARSSSSFVAFASADRMNASTAGESFSAFGHGVSGNYFSMFEIAPAAGRLLTEADDETGSEPVVVLGHRLWQQRFGGRPDAVGSAINLNGIPFTIVGVVPAGFHGTIEIDEDSDVFLTLAACSIVARNPAMMTDDGVWWIQMLGRTADVSRAEAELTGILRSLMRESRPQYAQTDELRISLLPGALGLSNSRSSFRTPVLLLGGLLGALFLLACTNVASLQLARSMRRRRETATRLALGASRLRIVRHATFESILVTAAAAVPAIFATPYATQLLGRLLPTRGASTAFDTSIDLRLLLCVLATALLGALLLAVPAALRSSRVEIADALRGRSDSGPRARLGTALVALQIGVSLALLVASAILMQSVRNIDRIELGFAPDNLVQFHLAARANGLSQEEISDLARRLDERISAIPGVESTSVSAYGLLAGGSMMSRAGLADPSQEPEGPHEYLKINLVDSDWLPTTGIRLVAGRGIAASDQAGGERVVVLDLDAAKLLFGEESPLGRTLYMLDSTYTVVGLTQPAKFTSIRGEDMPAAHLSLAQHLDRLGRTTFTSRFSGNAAQVMSAIRATVREVEPDLPPLRLELQRTIVDDASGQERSFARLAIGLGILATALACGGLYALLSFLVSARTRDTGIRIALGARKHDIVRHVLRDGAIALVAGSTLGIPAAIAAGRFAESILYEISARDPRAIALAVAAMAVVVVATSLVPALRASKVDPVKALRND